MKKFIKNGFIYKGEEILVRDGLNFNLVQNPTEELLLENGWTVYTEPQLTEEQRLLKAKEQMIRTINEYDASSNVNEFTVNGESMWLNYGTRLRLKTSIDAYKASNIETVTKWFNGTLYTFPVDTWLLMLALIEVYAAEAKNVTDAHINTVNNLSTVAEIENFDYTDGYPAKLQF